MLKLLSRESYRRTHLVVDDEDNVNQVMIMMEHKSYLTADLQTDFAGILSATSGIFDIRNA